MTGWNISIFYGTCSIKITITSKFSASLLPLINSLYGLSEAHEIMEHSSHTWLSWSPVQRALIMVLPRPHCPQSSFPPSIRLELYRVLKAQASVENHPHFLSTGSRHINNDVSAIRVFTDVWSKQYGICLLRLMEAFWNRGHFSHKA